MSEALIFELVGYVASVITIISLLMANVLRLRILNLGACILWLIYGILINANAVIATNAVLSVVNIYFIVKLLTMKELFNLVEIRKDSAYLQQFLNYYMPEILKFYPEYVYDETENIYAFIAFRNVTAAGLFLVEVREENQLYLKLEFTIPGYRDFRISRYVYADHSNVLRSALENGFSRIYSEIPASPNQMAYLISMGYREEEDNKRLCLKLEDFDLEDPTGAPNPWR